MFTPFRDAWKRILNERFHVWIKALFVCLFSFNVRADRFSVSFIAETVATLNFLNWCLSSNNHVIVCCQIFFCRKLEHYNICRKSLYAVHWKMYAPDKINSELSLWCCFLVTFVHYFVYPVTIMTVSSHLRSRIFNYTCK